MLLTNPTRVRSCTMAAIAIPLLALTTSQCARDPHAEMLKYVRSGDSYAAAGKLSEAVIEYRNAIQLDSRAGDVRLKLAEIYVQQGDAAKARDEYVRAADVLPDVSVQLKAGSILLVARRFDDAKYRAEKALAADPKNVDAQILLANALAGLKDLDAAVAELEQAIQLSPDRSATYSSLGVIEFGRGRKESAERAFKRAVDLAPRSAAPHLALAGFYWATSQWPEAERELTSALTAEPDNALAHRTAATFYLVTNRHKLAEPHLRRNLELTKAADAALALADYYVALSNEAAAREVLESLTKNPKTTASAATRLAALDHAAGRSEEARMRLESVLSVDSTQLPALLLKSGFLLTEGKPDEALRIAKTAAEAHPDSPAAFSAVGRAQIARRDTTAAIAAYQEAVRLNPLATDAKLALVRLELASGHAESAASLAQDVLNRQPANPDARVALVKALISRGDLPRAETELNTLAATFPDSPVVHVQRGMLYGRQKREASARREFERALALQPDLLEATSGLVALDLSTRQFEAARARVAALTTRPDTKPPALMLAARTYAATGDLKTSEELLRRVLSDDPSYLPAYAGLGQIYAKQGKLDAALNEFEAMARRDPKPVTALTLAGMLLEAQGKTAPARERYERVMQLDSSAPVAANNLAWIYAQSEAKLDTALELAQTARRALQNAPEVADTLGLIYYKKGLFSQAVRELSSAVSADDTNPAFHYHLGLALAKSGDKSAAAQHLSRALALKPDFEGSSEAKAILETLGT